MACLRIGHVCAGLPITAAAGSARRVAASGAKTIGNDYWQKLLAKTTGKNYWTVIPPIMPFQS
jgi:hypothetical protein